MEALTQTKERPEVAAYQLACDTCFSFLIAKISDLRKNHLNDGSFFMARCPSCGYESYVDGTELHKHIIPMTRNQRL